MQGQLSPAQLSNCQRDLETAQAAACAWAGEVGCWRLHSLAVGRRGDDLEVSVCAEVDLERLAAVAEAVRTVAEVEAGFCKVRLLEPTAEAGACLVVSYFGHRVVVAHDTVALRRGWTRPKVAWCPDPMPDGGFVVRLWGREVAGHALDGFAELVLSGDTQGCSLELIFSEPDRAQDWPDRLRERIASLRRFNYPVTRDADSLQVEADGRLRVAGLSPAELCMLAFLPFLPR
jgi:hypothetical protein